MVLVDHLLRGPLLAALGLLERRLDVLVPEEDGAVPLVACAQRQVVALEHRHAVELFLRLVAFAWDGPRGL